MIYTSSRLALPEDFTNYLTKSYSEASVQSSSCDTTAHLASLLLLSPNTLQTNTVFINETVSKHFKDNWIVRFHFGCLLNLCEAWEPFKAAKATMSEVTKPEKVREMALKHFETLEVCKCSVLLFLLSIFELFRTALPRLKY